MKRLLKVAIVIVFVVIALLAAGVVFTNQHFCIGNTDICFTSE